MVRSDTSPKLMPWAMFIAISVAGLNAFFVFPIQADYGPVATLFFKVSIFIALALTGWKFFYDMAKLDRLYKSR